VFVDSALAFLRRYQPIILTITAIAVIALLLPPVKKTPASSTSTTQSASGGTEVAPANGVGAPATTAGAGSASRAQTAAGAVSAAPPLTFEQARARGLTIDFGKNCDASTGRIKVPSRDAAPCVAQRTGPNGGATSKGVTAKEIVVVDYRAQPDPASDAIVQAAGANDSTANVEATFRDWKSYFESHYDTWGRKVKLIFMQGSGASADDAAARADARKVDLQYHAFAVWAHLGAPSAFTDELAARHIVYITGAADPTSVYIRNAPYGWGVLMNLDQGYQQAAEYIGKRLWGKPAGHAGPLLSTTKRKFGLIYGDDAAHSQRSAALYFQKALKQYGASVADISQISFDTTTSQEDARPIIQRFISEGITSIVFTGSPLTPVFLTDEASRQSYFPEWVMMGGNLVDTTFFGRTYDTTQWSHAFGISQLNILPPEMQHENWYQMEWQTCHAPTARAEYRIIYQPEWVFYTAVHLAGPVLTPTTFRNALFGYKPAPVGVSSFYRSFGRHGLWPSDDYGVFDDTTEVWWDPNAFGNDEISKPGKGMYRYVAGGKRYLAGQWPRTEPHVFVDPATAPTNLTSLSKQDDYPKYPELHCK
jgi:hypothetical protein